MIPARKLIVITFFTLMLMFSALPAIHAQAPPLIILYIFSNGNWPGPALMQANDGSFYGTIGLGGAHNYGSLYKMTPDGTLTSLYDFNQTDGSGPYNGLIQASDGNLYGSTGGGGANSAGTLFKITLGGTLTTLHAFATQTDPTNLINADGLDANTLIQAQDGNFYGTTMDGGANGNGVIFKLTPSGTYTLLHVFSALDSNYSNSDGAAPRAGLIQGTDGALYGTTRNGGANHTGTVFKITTSGTFTTLYTFGAALNGTTYVNTDGIAPEAPLLQAADGNFYGTTQQGGTNKHGTLFKITSSGTLTTLYTFSATDDHHRNADGFYPAVGLIQGSDGALYGAAEGGGPNAAGTIFKITTSGVFTVLHAFTGYDGGIPVALLQVADGSFYGLTEIGVTGTNSKGALFHLLSKAPIPSDFNGDNHSDLVFQNPTTGQLAVWFMNGTSAQSGALVYPSQDPNWRCVGDADLNQDGKPDLIFQNKTTGQLAYWLMNGTSATSGNLISSSQDPSWQAAGLADFNEDGRPDILFQNTTTGQLAIWLMNGVSAYTGLLVGSTSPSGWYVVGTGDFNGDGQPDILFQNSTTGQLAVWFLSATTVTGGAYITPIQNPAWKCVAVLDLNSDGQPDLVFQNVSSGKLVYWLMNGVTAMSGGYLTPSLPSGWSVAGPR